MCRNNVDRRLKGNCSLSPYTNISVMVLFSSLFTGCIKMIGAVWKLIIFTSMAKRLINTSRNETVTLQVHDTCLQMCDFCGLRRKDCLTRSTLSSDTRDRPALFPLQRHPVVWNCWYQRLMLLGDGGITVELSPEWPAEQKQLIRASQIAAHKTPSAPESPLSLCYVTDRERRGEWDYACAQNLNTCCFVPCGKLTSACVLKAVMTDWNCSNHFDTPCTIDIHRVAADILYPLFSRCQIWKAGFYTVRTLQDLFQYCQKSKYSSFIFSQSPLAAPSTVP